TRGSHHRHSSRTEVVAMPTLQAMIRKVSRGVSQMLFAITVVSQDISLKRLADQQQNYGRGGGTLQRREPTKMAYAVGSESRSDAWHPDTASEWHITYDVSELEDVRAVQPEEKFTVVGYDGSRHQPTHVGRYTMLLVHVASGGAGQAGVQTVSRGPSPVHQEG
ncbi:hypothetical protein VaNZ11_006782, partial [Volvox africanus]